ncbi:MAG: HEAT repeat domain-containing protein [Planctomycetaceae bacterium]
MTSPSRALPLRLLLAAAASGDPASDAAKELKQRWRSLDAPGRIEALRSLEPMPSAALLRECKGWLADKEPAVRGAVAKAAAACAALPALREQARALLADYLGKHLDARARREREEFEAVCRKFGRAIPPDDEMAAGADWSDPYDPKRRALPEEIVAERGHMRAVLEAAGGAGGDELRAAVRRAFREHHDPEVVAAAATCLGRLRSWEALADLADLLRLQSYGREVGGADVIGREAYETMRLKWDVHKDRLWWSRPEYVPRAGQAIREAASAIVGRPIESCGAFDRWMLDHEAELTAHGVTLDAAFRRRAASTQR